MPFHLETSSDGHPFHANKAIVVDSKGRHYSSEPIPMERAKAQKRVLESKLGKHDDPPKDPTPKKFIQEAIKRPGAFTKKAKAHGETPKEYMEEDLAHPEEHDTRTRKQAQFMKTLMSFHKSK